MLKTTMKVKGIHAGGAFAYGGAAVDSVASRYYLADRTNAALDVFDTKKLTQIAQVNDRFTSPGAVVVAGGNVYVGDVNRVHVIDKATLTAMKPIAITHSGFRTEDGCFDPDDDLLM
ncbi:MAG: hypothetical protein ACREMT_10265, partial [Vulcanimicrobiaceae bacterium]